MALLALAIRQPADGQQIGRVEETNALFQSQSKTGVELIGDVEKVGGRETLA